MTIQDRKSRESSQLRQRILSAALRVFAEHGYRRVSMRRIAALVEYSPTTIYRFFRNKEELLCALASDTYRELSAKFAAVKSANTGSAVATLRALIAEYVAFCVGRPEMFALYSDLASFEMEEGAMVEVLGETRYRVYQSWFECIRRAIETGEVDVRDEVRVFLFIWDAVSGYVDHRINQPRVSRKALAADATEYLDLVFRGIGARPVRPSGEENNE